MSLLTHQEWAVCMDANRLLTSMVTPWQKNRGTRTKTVWRSRNHDRKLRLIAIATVRRRLMHVQDTKCVDLSKDPRSHGNADDIKTWSVLGDRVAATLQSLHQLEDLNDFTISPHGDVLSNRRQIIGEGLKKDTSLARALILTHSKPEWRHSMGWYLHECLSLCRNDLYKSLGKLANCELELHKQADLIREIVGDPTCPPILEWLDGELMQVTYEQTELGLLNTHQQPMNNQWLNFRGIQQLANTVYNEDRWDEVGVLGDMLEDSGCTIPELVHHCRGTVPCPPSKVVNLTMSCPKCGKLGEFSRLDSPTYVGQQQGRYVVCAQHPEPMVWKLGTPAGVKCEKCNGTGRRPSLVRHCKGCVVVDLLAGKEMSFQL